jgi:hypothetical protein
MFIWQQLENGGIDGGTEGYFENKKLVFMRVSRRHSSGFTPRMTKG